MRMRVSIPHPKAIKSGKEKASPERFVVLALPKTTDIYPPNRGILGAILPVRHADVMELADMRDLGSRVARRRGSKPFIRTTVRCSCGRLGYFSFVEGDRGTVSACCVPIADITQTVKHRLRNKEFSLARKSIQKKRNGFFYGQSNLDKKEQKRSHT